MKNFILQTMSRVALAAVCFGFLTQPGIGQPPKADSRFDSHLASGEFSSARQIAEGRPSGERDSLLSRLAQAQAAAGAHSGAARTLATITNDSLSHQAMNSLAGGSSVADSAAPMGGGAVADFQTLMDLIRETIDSDSWDDAEGNGRMQPFPMGVRIDAKGVLQLETRKPPSTPLAEIRKSSLADRGNRDVRRKSSLRKVSLSRLERQLHWYRARGLPPTDAMRHVAGIHRISHVFLYPQSQEVVIAGPADEWFESSAGRHLSQSTREPTLWLDDWIEVWKNSRQGDGSFLCSIEPQADRLQGVVDFLAETDQTANRTLWMDELRKKLGKQDIVIEGVDPASRMAHVIVEADYRMKQIGIGEVNGARGMKSYFDLLTRSEQRGRNNMDALRWWMAVGYESIGTTDAGHAFAFTGNSVRCLSEDQILNADGTRSATGTARGANAGFADLFTRHFTELAAHDAAFADLENVFDLAMVSALLHSDGLAAEAGWQPRGFAGRGAYKPDSVDVPDELMTAAAHRVYGGRHIVVQVAGGVRGDMASVASDPERFRISGELTDSSQQASPVGHNADVWWWDAAIRQPE